MTPSRFNAASMVFRMMNDRDLWWVVTIFWQGEDDKHPLPEKYLEGKN
jgi:hypothetical protein